MTKKPSPKQTPRDTRPIALTARQLRAATGGSCGFQDYEPTWWDKFVEYGWVEE